MATRALIGYLDDSKVLTTTYNHYDGNPEYLGKKLKEFYNTDDLAKEIANTGYISSIEEDGSITSKYDEIADKINLDDDIIEAGLTVAHEIKAISGEYGYIWIGLRVVPMGWLSAVGVVQYLHRRLCLLPRPWGAALDPKIELRRNVGPPVDASGRHSRWWQLYVDNFDAGNATTFELMDEKKREIGKWQKHYEEAAAFWGVPLSEDQQVHHR